ncbi:hypothetical protein IM676_16725 [Anabaenopsis elenkinii CCIBt3563]|uniref:Uncharacterized protein n=1 Tax=Anabaenopsis elenkinii CCIBt3563 TaxID=2779889 RepID=A0A7S6RCJ4_9CYAN|nr:hypothetical protein IM676_16725 [Anabaenopsis elenkinii CCIBt3563]
MIAFTYTKIITPVVFISKDVTSGQAKHLGLGQQFNNSSVVFAKLGTVVFIKLDTPLT